MWVQMQKMELRDWWEYGDRKTRINELNEKRSLEREILILEFCGLPNCLDVGKGRKLPYAA